jgi:esterase/lipase superfamily enzyme
VDAVDEESFLNEKVEPPKQLMRQQQFDSYIMEEVIPYIQQRNSIGYMMVAGVDLGGYHAVNLALKHPREFNKAIGISGVYDVRSFFGEFYSDTLYYNNPIDFVPNLNKQPLLNEVRNVDFRLVSYANDERKASARQLGNIFRSKFIEHQLDVWDTPSTEEWDVWKKMLNTHII